MTTAIRAADFVSAIGVQTHMAFTDVTYANVTNVIADLEYLGLDTVRDSAPASTRQLAAYNTMANAGIHFDLLVQGDLATRISAVSSFAAAHPGAVIAVEGPNEVNTSGATLGLDDAAAQTAYMHDLVAAVHGSTALSGVAIYGLTGASASTAADVNAGADYGNRHIYPAHGDQPYEWLAKVQAEQMAIDGKSAVITEAGYYTAPVNSNGIIPTASAWGGVDQTTQAKLTLNLLMDASKLGYQQTFLYQLLDTKADSTGMNVDKNIGLFDINNQPKQAAVAIHNLTSILADDASSAGSFQTHDVAFMVKDLPDLTSVLQIQKSSGVTDLVLWSEPDIWDYVNYKPISAAPASTTIDFGNNHVTIKAYDPLVGTTAVATYTNVTSVTLAVLDHPLILEVTDIADPAGTIRANPKGGAGDDLISGTSVADLLSGGGGNDDLSGGAGADTIDGGAGDDTIDGGTGADRMIGGDGNDSYVVDNAGDVVDETGAGGIDTVTASVGFTLGVNVENLVLTGAGPLNGTGNALANHLAGSSGANVLSGLDGDDTLEGGAGNDTLKGGAGNDILDGGTGADHMIGGDGNDSYVVDNLGDVVDETGTGGIDDVSATVSFTLGANVENLDLVGQASIDGTGNALANRMEGSNGANVLAGLDGNDTLLGSGGNDTLKGGEGADSLDGGTGADHMIGGNGNDSYVVDNAGDVVDETGTGGIDDVSATISYTLGANVENLDLGGSKPINGTGNALGNLLTGNDAANILTGLGGDDTLQSGGGNDTLYGGEGADRLDGRSGADRMIGGNGNDSYIVDNAGDIVDETGTNGIDSVTSSVSFTLGANVENLTLTGNGSLNGTGNGLANLLTGTGAANILTGLGGDDTLLGGWGNDTLYGGEGADRLDGGGNTDRMIGGNGNDSYIVDSSSDVVDETNSTGIDTVWASASFTLGANVENLNLVGTAINGVGNSLANVIDGNDAANVLKGMDGNDTLSGGLGDDKLNGGAGIDSLIGGAGNDWFVFDNVTTSANRDIVADFTHDQDHIALTRSAFSAYAGKAAGALGSSQFVVGTHALTASQHVIYDHTTGALYYDDDGSGAHAQIQLATLTGHPILDAGDFLLV